MAPALASNRGNLLAEDTYAPHPCLKVTVALGEHGPGIGCTRHQVVVSPSAVIKC